MFNTILFRAEVDVITTPDKEKPKPDLGLKLYLYMDLMIVFDVTFNKYHSSYIKHMSDQKYKLSDQLCHDLTQMSGQCYILIISTVVADLSIRGVWQSQTVASFDVRVIDTDAPSYLHRDVSSVLSSAEEEKKRKYIDAAEAGVLHLHH